MGRLVMSQIQGAERQRKRAAWAGQRRRAARAGQQAGLLRLDSDPTCVCV